MPEYLQFILVAILLILSVHFLAFAAKNERARVIDDIDKDFTLRYPRAFLYACIVFFVLLLSVLLRAALSGGFMLIDAIFAVLFTALAIPLLLLSAVFKLKIRTKKIVYVGMFGIKHNIFYNNISTAILSRKSLSLVTNQKIYRFYPYLVYREYLLKRLAQNGINVERFDI